LRAAAQHLRCVFCRRKCCCLYRATLFYMHQTFVTSITFAGASRLESCSTAPASRVLQKKMLLFISSHSFLYASNFCNFYHIRRCITAWELQHSTCVACFAEENVAVYIKSLVFICIKLCNFSLILNVSNFCNFSLFFNVSNFCNFYHIRRCITAWELQHSTCVACFARGAEVHQLSFLYEPSSFSETLSPHRRACVKGRIWRTYGLTELNCMRVELHVELHACTHTRSGSVWCVTFLVDLG